MKALILSLLLLPAFAIAQSKQDYINVMEQFMRYYNKRDGKSICKIFSPEHNTKHGCFWELVEKSGIYDEYGKLVSYKYLGPSKEDPNDISVFRMEYEKTGVHAMSFNLDSTLHFGTFRFKTSSNEINKMMVEVK